MAEKNGLGFLGRVPIDTVLVRLLDAVSKGEVPGVAVLGNGEEGKVDGKRAEIENEHSEDVEGQVGEEARNKVEFPLLDKYLETTSSKVWKGIAGGVVEGIEKRRTEIASRLQAASQG